MSERINNIVEDIKEQYLEDDNNIPWIIGFSGKLPILGYPLLDGRQSAPV